MFGVVRDLEELLSQNPKLSALLSSSISEAEISGISDLPSYYNFLDECLRWIPIFKDRREFYSKLAQFYCFLSGSFGAELQNNLLFNNWLLSFFQTWGDFLSTKESSYCLGELVEDPDFYVSDYLGAKDSWHSFNEFMRRQIKPQKRPFTSCNANNILSCPVDGICRNIDKIGHASVIKIDNISLRLDEILSNTAYKDNFMGGVYIHISMCSNDYQRYAMPSNGIILDQQKIPSIVSFGIAKEKGGIYAAEGDSCQFVQDRGIMIFNNPTIGLIALIPISLVQVASVIFTSEIGSSLGAGDELGYFESGGSDLIMLCSNSNVNIVAEKNKHHNQGNKMAFLA